MAWAQPATGAVTGESIVAGPVPTTQSAVSYAGLSLNLGWNTTYDADFNPVLQRAVLHLDNGFRFDTTGVAPCQLSSIESQFHDQAVAACPNSLVATGGASVNDGAVAAIVDVFKASASADTPAVFVHFDVGPGATTFTVPGTFGAWSRGGDFGTQIDMGPFLNTPGLAITQLNLFFPNEEPSPAHHLVSAGCEPDQIWNFAGDLTYYGGTATTASAASRCSSVPAITGKRAAALKKCKKKRSKQARQKCRRKARKLPA